MKYVKLNTAVLTVALAATALSACARPSQASTSPTASAPAAERPVADTVAAEPKAVPMVVHKSPYCGCCKLWVEHMRGAGFAVEVRESNNLHPIKERLGVPVGKGSCHTAQVGGYFIEGHVPAEDVKRLLAERPDARGLTVPGMPKGSPGMEVPDGSADPYTVELVGKDGSTTPFAQH